MSRPNNYSGSKFRSVLEGAPSFAEKNCKANLPSLFLPPGVLLITLALCADAAIGNVQEKALKAHSASNVEMVCSCGSWHMHNEHKVSQFQ